MTTWGPSSWKNKKALQMPVYRDKKKLEEVLGELKKMPPLVFAGEVRSLKQKLASVSKGEAILLQGGDCAESFKEFSVDYVRNNITVLFRMALVLIYGTGLPVIKVGRIAGQFSKPRSAENETKDGIELPVYRGDIVNDVNFDEDKREPDPNRMLKAYNQSVQTLNLIRAFCQGGYADLFKLNKWNLEYVDNEQANHYKEIAAKVNSALKMIKAFDLGIENNPQFKRTSFYTSHEALLLPYEEALTRCDTITSDNNEWVNTSAHMLWVGERTRQLDGAHVEFLSGLINPIGCKISDALHPDELISLIDKLNPQNELGKLTLITRFGIKKIEKYLPPLIEKVKQEGRNVIWVCDPMHGNTEIVNDYKTRRIDSVFSELRSFFSIHNRLGTHPGGIHLEMTGEDVTECVGGAYEVLEEDINSRYNTHCDPRLNANQALEVAFWLAENTEWHDHLK